MRQLHPNLTTTYQFMLAILAALLIVLCSSTIIVSAQLIIAPVFMSVIIGLMFGPVSDRLEKFGAPAWLSSLAVVFCFFFIIIAILSAIVIPLSGWVAKLPLLWSRLQQLFADWEGILSALEGIRERIDGVVQNDADVVVQVDEGSAITNVFTIAPVVLAQLLMFLASLFFFVATRKQIKDSVVRNLIVLNAGYRGARIFKDVEHNVSRYLLSITLINICVALVVATALWLIGIPGALMWGILAGLLNYITYVGPALMLAAMVGVGLLTFDTGNAALLPAITYLTINFVESQFITPMLIGRAMTLNPFLVFLSITFWIWAWGPLGGLVAVPSLIIGRCIFCNLHQSHQKLQ
ncbi:AI-2E family transporter [Maritalea porphyrae]|nr:AI-2E family transporter [Maritalea porphyrae]